MEIIITTALAATAGIAIYVAFIVGVGTGQARFKNKVNRLTVRKMLEHKRSQFKHL
jgi:hypothetical protein